MYNAHMYNYKYAANHVMSAGVATPQQHHMLLVYTVYVQS